MDEVVDFLRRCAEQARKMSNRTQGELCDGMVDRLVSERRDAVIDAYARGLAEGYRMGARGVDRVG